MGSELSEMDGYSYQFEIDDFAVDYPHGRLVRITHRKTEYDYDLPHHHWYRTKDGVTGEEFGGLTRGDRLKGPLNEMEVLAWATKTGV